MLNKIIKLCNKLNEEWVGNVKTSWKKDDFIDVFKNPSKSEIIKMTQGGKNPIRFFIALNGDLYVWGFLDAQHDEVAQQLYQHYSVKGTYYNPTYVEFFKVKNPQPIYNKVKDSKLMNVLDDDYQDNLSRRELTGANEKFAGYVDSDFQEELVPVEKNVSYGEFMKLLKNSSSEILRVLLSENGTDFYVWDADLALHSEVEEQLSASSYRYKMVVYKDKDSDYLLADFSETMDRGEAEEFVEYESKSFSKLRFVKNFKIGKVYLYPEISFKTGIL